MSAGPTGNAAACLHPALAALAASGADRFNPVRFRYIRRMADRSLEQGETVAELVATRALAALQAYQAELSRQRAEAEVLGAQVAASHPAMAAQVQAQLEACNFRAVKRLAARRQRPPATGPLAALVQRLNAGAGPTPDKPEPGPLSELVHDQEADAVRFMSAAGANVSPRHATGELKAARYFRDALQRQYADKLVSRSMLEAPADSGPLNPQKLAIQSLAAMRELSPAYLARFVTYVDTLFWLEKAGESNKS